MSDFTGRLMDLQMRDSIAQAIHDARFSWQGGTDETFDQHLAEAVLPFVNRMRTVAREVGWEAADLEAFQQGGMIQTYPNICSSGVGGGEVCMRRKGHDGEHDPDSTEVRL